MERGGSGGVEREEKGHIGHVAGRGVDRVKKRHVRATVSWRAFHSKVTQLRKINIIYIII